MLSVWTIIVSFFTLLTSIAVFYIAGVIISYSSKPRPSFDANLFFPCLIKGFLFLVSLYAIWITKGKTILLLVPVLLLMVGFLKKPVLIIQKESENIKFKQLILFILTACLLYSVYYSQAFITNGELVNYAGGDTSFYARAAYNLQLNGIENPRIEYLYPQRFNPEPYHYYDLWFVAGVSKITGINTHLVYLLIIYPFFAVVFVTGIWTFLKKNFVIIMVLISLKLNIMKTLN